MDPFFVLQTADQDLFVADPSIVSWRHLGHRASSEESSSSTPFYSLNIPVGEIEEDKMGGAEGDDKDGAGNSGKKDTQVRNYYFFSNI